MSAPPLVVVISGLDPTGGAGLLADIRALSAAAVRIAPIISASTVQGKNGVARVHAIPATVLCEQLEILFSQFQVHAVKIGALGNARQVRMLAAFLQHAPDVPVVLDPVLGASSGGRLTSDAMKIQMIKHLFPQITLLTPNVNELHWLTEQTEESDEESAVNFLLDIGIHAILVKGGHRSGPPEDVLYLKHEKHVFHGTRFETNVRGTGCHLASYITGMLARGYSLQDSVARGHRYIRRLFTSYKSAGAHILPAWNGG